MINQIGLMRDEQNVILGPSMMKLLLHDFAARCPAHEWLDTATEQYRPYNWSAGHGRTRLFHPWVRVPEGGWSSSDVSVSHVVRPGLYWTRVSHL